MAVNESVQRIIGEEERSITASTEMVINWSSLRFLRWMLILQMLLYRARTILIIQEIGGFTPGLMLTVGIDILCIGLLIAFRHPRPSLYRFVAGVAAFGLATNILVAALIASTPLLTAIALVSTGVWLALFVLAWPYIYKSV
jgi:hypothetical protein